MHVTRRYAHVDPALNDTLSTPAPNHDSGFVFQLVSSWSIHAAIRLLLAATGDHELCWPIFETHAANEKPMIQIDRLDLLITAVCASFAYFHVGPRTFSLEDPKFYY